MPAIERIDALIGAFRTLRSAQSAQRLEAMQGLLTNWDPSRSPPTFNVFSLLDLTSDEVRHTRFLAWLLDAKGGHQQGDLFMRAFVRASALDIPEDDLGRYGVRREFPGRESVVDIMAYRLREFVIFIENKIHAGEGASQLAREFRDMRRVSESLRVREERQHAVFLTLGGRAPESADGTHWVPLSYHHLAAELKASLPQVTDDKVRLVVQDWLDTLATWRE